MKRRLPFLDLFLMLQFCTAHSYSWFFSNLPYLQVIIYKIIICVGGRIFETFEHFCEEGSNLKFIPSTQPYFQVGGCGHSQLQGITRGAAMHAYTII